MFFTLNAARAETLAMKGHTCHGKDVTMVIKIIKKRIIIKGAFELTSHNCFANKNAVELFLTSSPSSTVRECTGMSYGWP